MEGVVPMGKPSKSIYKVTIKADLKKQTLSTDFNPEPTLNSRDDENVGIYLQALLQGVRVGLNNLLKGLPVLRPATDLEREHKIYVTVEEADEHILKLRKNLYSMVADAFQVTLTELFPDVEYVVSVQNHQQELAFEQSQAEMDAHKKLIDKITEEVKEIVYANRSEKEKEENETETTAS